MNTALDTDLALENTLSELISAMHRLTRIVAADTGNTVSPAIWRTLSVLAGSGPMRLGQLATETRVSQPTATKLVQGLCEQEWIKRIADSDDARAWQLSIAPKGERALRGWRETIGRTLAVRFSGLEQEERDTLARAVQIITARIDLSS